MSGADLDERLAHLEQMVEELYALLLAQQIRLAALARTDHHGLGRSGMQETQP